MFQGNLGWLEFRDFRALNVRDLTTNRKNKGLAKIKGFTVGYNVGG
jgi:hypothetical protein